MFSSAFSKVVSKQSAVLTRNIRGETRFQTLCNTNLRYYSPVAKKNLAHEPPALSEPSSVTLLAAVAVATAIGLQSRNEEHNSVQRKGNLPTFRLCPVAHAKDALLTPGYSKQLRNPLVSTKTQDWDVCHDKILGKGAYGVVKAATCRQTGEKVAVKMIDTKKSHPVSLRNEVKIMRKLQSHGGHENIVALKDIYYENNGGQQNLASSSLICLVTELVSGGELLDHVIEHGAYSEEEARQVLKEISKAIYFMHSHGVSHNDLKLENILLSSSKTTSKTSIKVADFGSATFATNDDEDPSLIDSNMRSSRIIGTSAYWPPEVMEKVISNSNATSVGELAFKRDMWALGLIFFILLTGAHPFDLQGTASEWETLSLIRKHEVLDVENSSPVWKNVSQNTKKILLDLLHKDPTKRLSAKQLVQMLE